MSLFGNLFTAPGAQGKKKHKAERGVQSATSSLFDTGSVWKQDVQQPQQAVEPVVPVQRQAAKQERKRKAAPLTDAAGTSAPAEAAAVPNTGKGKQKRVASEAPQGEGQLTESPEAAPTRPVGAARAKAALQPAGKLLAANIPDDGGAATAAQPAARGRREKAKQPHTAVQRTAATPNSGTESTDEEDDARPAQVAAQLEAEGSQRRPQLTPEEEAERLGRTLFVGNLPAAVRRKRVAQLFAQFGPIESVRLRSVPVDLQAKMPRAAAIKQRKVDATRAPANAYVVFQDTAAATAALGLNMTQVEDHHIQVDRATAPRRAGAGGTAAAAGAEAAGGAATRYDPTRTLFCGNLHFAATNEEVLQFFAGPEALEGNPELAPDGKAGKPAVEAVRVVRDAASNIGKGFAYVLFRSQAAARAGLSLNGRPLRGRPLRITRASPQVQARVHRAREVAVAAASGRPAVRGPGAQPLSQRGSAVKKGGSLHGTYAAAWQGTVTKGKGKGVRGLQLKQGRTGGLGVVGGGVRKVEKSARAGGKRPAVAARKAAAKKTKGPGGPKA